MTFIFLLRFEVIAFSLASAKKKHVMYWGMRVLICLFFVAGQVQVSDSNSYVKDQGGCDIVLGDLAGAMVAITAVLFLILQCVLLFGFVKVLSGPKRGRGVWATCTSISCSALKLY